MSKICAKTIDTICDNSEKYPVSSFFVNALFVSLEQLEYAEEKGGEDADRIIGSLQNMIDIYVDLLCKSYELESRASVDDGEEWSIE